MDISKKFKIIDEDELLRQLYDGTIFEKNPEL